MYIYSKNKLFIDKKNRSTLRLRCRYNSILSVKHRTAKKSNKHLIEIRRLNYLCRQAGKQDSPVRGADYEPVPSRRSI